MTLSSQLQSTSQSILSNEENKATLYTIYGTVLMLNMQVNI